MGAARLLGRLAGNLADWWFEAAAELGDPFARDARPPFRPDYRPNPTVETPKRDTVTTLIVWEVDADGRLRTERRERIGREVGR